MSDKKNSSNGPRLRVTMSLADMSPPSGKASSSSSEDLLDAPKVQQNARRPSLATPEEFVNHHEGKRPINKVLIANNGIAGNGSPDTFYSFSNVSSIGIRLNRKESIEFYVIFNSFQLSISTSSDGKLALF